MDSSRKSVPLESFPEALHDLLRGEIDLDASGGVGFSDVRAMVVAYKAEKQRISFLKWLILGGGVALVFMSSATFGVSFAAAELAKDVEPNADGVMMVRSSGTPMLNSQYTISGTELITTGNRRLQQQFSNTSTDGFFVHLMDMDKTTKEQACRAYAQGAASELNMHMAGGLHHLSIDLAKENCMVGRAIYARQAYDWNFECPSGSDVCHMYTAELHETFPSTGPESDLHDTSPRRLHNAQSAGTEMREERKEAARQSDRPRREYLDSLASRYGGSWANRHRHTSVFVITKSVHAHETHWTSMVREDRPDYMADSSSRCYQFDSGLCGSDPRDTKTDGSASWLQCCMKSVICTYMHDAGRITQEEWKISQATGGELPKLVYRGYRYWADVTVGDLNALHGTPKEQMEIVWEYFVKSYLRQVAWFTRNPVGEFSLMGVAMMLTGYPVCFVLGWMQHAFPTLMLPVQVGIAHLLEYVASTVYHASQVSGTSVLAVSLFLFARSTRSRK